MLTKHLLDDGVEGGRSARSANARSTSGTSHGWSACDLLIADASGSSFGVGFEVGYVLGRSERTKQPVCCSTARDRLSHHLAAHPGNIAPVAARSCVSTTLGFGRSCLDVCGKSWLKGPGAPPPTRVQRTAPEMLLRRGGVRGHASAPLPARLAALQPVLHQLHVDVEDRRHVERQRLRDEQAADDGEAERAARLRRRRRSRARSAACPSAPPWSSS